MKTKAYLYIIAAAVCWGLIGFFVRTLAAQGFSSMQIVALRSLAAAICVTLPLLRSGSAALRIRLRDLWLFVGTGICSLVFFNYCYFNAMQQTSLAVAALLLYTAPVFVMLMSLVCFGEAFTRTKALALLLTFSGCACVTGVFVQRSSLWFRQRLRLCAVQHFRQVCCAQIFVTHHYRLHLLSGTRSFMAARRF